MKKNPNISILVILLITVLIGSMLGGRLDRLYESQAFLQWIAAAEADNRIKGDQESTTAGEETDAAGEESSETPDADLYREVVAATQTAIAERVGVENLREGQTALSAALENSDHDGFVYRLIKSRDLAPLRTRFLDELREGKLELTNEVTYAAVVSGLEGEGSVSIFNLFFGFRKVAANFIWLQVDRYWHSGDVQRMVPLMKTCVLLDPHFVDAYLLGSWHLGYNVPATIDYTPLPLRHWSEKYRDCLGEQESYYYTAVDFLKDGIRNNPRNYKLYFDLGFGLYREKLKDNVNAEKYLNTAAHLPHERWVPRMWYKSLEDIGDYERALEGWRYNLTLYKDHSVSLRSIERLNGLIAERKSDEARRNAKATSDPAEREAYMAECRKYAAEAMEIWKGMSEGFADGRMLRLEAIDRAEKGYYLEAVSLLDKGRFEVGSLFEEFSNLIIEFKQAGGLPLSLSESKQLIREEEGVRCIGMPDSEVEARVAALKEKRKPIL